ncbi:hypothetical protein PFISCL1PPCAC_282, partial [Pristionchus fissidentatus]
LSQSILAHADSPRMIARLLSIFCLLSTEFLQSYGFEYHIDVDRCKQETVCYVRQSCAKGDEDAASAKVLLQFRYDNNKLKNGTCDVIMQIKQYSTKKWHVMMQLNGSYSNKELDSRKGISLFHVKNQFSCAPNNNFT